MKLSYSIRFYGSLLGVFLFAGFLSSCRSTGGGAVADTGYGPFDSRGNYVEAWADSPEKWNRRPTSQDALPDTEPVLLASNDTPPSTMTPISTSSSSGAVEVARLKPTTTSTATSSSSSTKPKSTSTVSKTTSKPKTVAAKSRSSSPTRVVVKKGDTLWGLATRHKSSVTAIQKANSLSSSNLKIGRSLVIPRT